MMDSDVQDAALAATNTMPDARIQFFYDPAQLTGKAVAASLGDSEEVAWDIYLFYKPGRIWRDLPPSPDTYMHQLVDSWADQSHLFQDEELKQELYKAMQTLTKEDDSGGENDG